MIKCRIIYTTFEGWYNSKTIYVESEDEVYDYVHEIETFEGRVNRIEYYK